jgi:hypothetical protein
MKRYLRNLSNHPGLGYASFFTMLGALAGFQRDGTLRSSVIGALVMSVFWIPVLITSNHHYDD